MKPKVGEYWYISDYSSEYTLFYIELIQNNNIFYGKKRMIPIPILGYVKSRQNEISFIQKWEPNWFWRMLGYK